MASMLFIVVAGVLVFGAMLGLLIRIFLVVVMVENSSMSPTLLPGDRVLAVRHVPTRWLRKGQIVLVWPWQNSSAQPKFFQVTLYIKRVAGLGGETLTTAINGPLVFRDSSDPTLNSHQGERVWQIPPRHLFVLGDNRRSSQDSRDWGPLPARSVLGVALMKLPRKVLGPIPIGDDRQRLSARQDDLYS
jgi:signal peptidase I